jgi:CheY-like chemotaxis protein
VTVRVRITRKFANTLNGFDVSRFHVGDVVDVPDSEATILIVEGWAEPVLSGEVLSPILVVEDDDATRHMFASCLRAQGFAVVEARDGREGLAALVTHRPAVVVLDLKMPRMGGRQFRKHQRHLSDPVLANVPVIVVSALDDAREQATELQAVDIMQKPVAPEQLVSLVAKQVGVGYQAE